MLVSDCGLTFSVVRAFSLLEERRKDTEIGGIVLGILLTMLLVASGPLFLLVAVYIQELMSVGIASPILVRSVMVLARLTFDAGNSV